jgi:hypothetical protein
MERHDNSTTRREFFAGSALTFASLLSAASPIVQAQNAPAGKPRKPHFGFGIVNSPEETRRLLLPSAADRRLGGTTTIGVPFWWDPDANKLVNPTKLQYDPKITAGDYTLDTTLLSFRASPRELGDVWGKLSQNAQLNINPGSVTSDGDRLEWIIMTGINVIQNIFSSKDSKLVSLNSNNQPTSSLRKPEVVTFKKGICSLALTLSAQKKKSVWDHLLAAVKTFTGSSVFGMLPIPKLYESAIQSVTASLDQLETQSNLIRILSGNAYRYKLYDGANASADLVLRNGHWVVLNADFAAAHMDADRNLKDVYLDIPGLLYQLKDQNNQRIDTTYAVAQLDLTPQEATKS